MLQAWGVFLEGLEKFLHLESRSNMSNLMITELFLFTFSQYEQRLLHKKF